MNEEKRVKAPRYDALPIDVSVLVRLLVIGAATGLMGWLLYLAIANYFIVPVFCRSADAFTICNNGGTIAWVSAHVIALVAAVAVMARMAIYRPLLVALAVLASLWSAQAWLGELSWQQGMVWQVALFALAFALYGWLARASNFLYVVLATVLFVLVSRVVLLFA